MTDIPTIDCGIRTEPQEEILALKIEQCSDSLYWYRDFVGKYVPYVRVLHSEHNYLSREPAGYVNIVNIKDARLVVVKIDTKFY